MGLALGSNSLKSNLNLILIKNVLSFNEVAVFDLISKLLNIANTVIDLISQTVFPKLRKEKNKNSFKAFKIRYSNIYSYDSFIYSFWKYGY